MIEVDDSGSTAASERPPTGAAPESVVVLVMTDVQGSTRLWAEYPTAMNAAMARHHAIVHKAVTGHHGWRPTDQGEGDAVFAAFDSAPAALAAVVEFQTALAAEPWPGGIELKVRVGIHAGSVVERDGNLFGSTVNRCARIRDLGSGGQVVLSSVVFELVRDSLPEGVAVTDLGEHRMKDLTRPEHLYQLSIPGGPQSFPPLASLNRARHNLPVETSSFLGREAEIADVVDLVRRERLVTIVGFGGMGKTRLALQAAAQLADGTGDGVWFIDLSNATSVDQVPSLIATTLWITDEVDGALPAVVRALATRRLLLVLDNLEQLLPAASVLVNQLLRAGPDVRVLATSREPLRLTGETEYAIGPLPLPPDHPAEAWSEVDVRSLATYEAIGLFVTRSSAVRRDFQLTAANAAAVATICSRLDGMPLALELAAARIRLLSPEALLPRLNRALGVLSRGNRDLPSRHQTLRATITWSYDALAPEHRSLLDRLSIFPGTFTFDAAEAICGSGVGPGDDDLDVLDGMAALVDRSLVQRISHDDQNAPDRYRLLVSIREFAIEQLDASGLHDQLLRRHAGYFADLITLPPEFTIDHIDREAQAELDDLHNIRAALSWARYAHDGELEPRLSGIAGLLMDLGLGQEGRAVADRALSSAAPGTPQFVEMLATRSKMEMVSQRYDDARGWATKCLLAARELGDLSLLILALAGSVPRSRAEAARAFAEIDDLVSVLPDSGSFYPPWWVELWREAIVETYPFANPTRVEAATRHAVQTCPAAFRPMWRGIFGRVLLLHGRFGEAEKLIAPFEQQQGSPGAAHGYQPVGAIDAANLRTVLGDFSTAAADLALAEQRLQHLDMPSLTAQMLYQRAVLHRVTCGAIAAEQLLKEVIAGSARARPGNLVAAQCHWLLSVIHREQDHVEVAATLLEEAWAACAGWDAVCLPLIVECLLERAIHRAPTHPAEAVWLIGVAVANLGSIPLLDGVTYDTDGMLADLRSSLGDDQVERILAVARTQELPDAPTWPEPDLSTTGVRPPPEGSSDR